MNMKWRNVFIALFVFCVITFILYFPALRAPFFHDDNPEILHNPAVVELSRLPSFSKLSGLWQRPLTLMTYQLNAWIGGGNPFGYHFINIGLHVATAFVFFLWARRRRYRAAVWCALLLLAHPLATSSVSYISGRGYILGTLLTLLALLVSSNGRGWRLTAGFFLALLACLAKPFFLVFLFLVPCAAVENVGRTGEFRRRWYLFALPLLFMLPYLIVRLPGQLGDALITADIQFRALPVIWGKIIWLFLVPVRLGFFHGAELVETWGIVRLAFAHFLMGIIIFAVFFKFVSEYHERSRRWLVPLSWLFLGIVGLTLLPKNELLAEWRLYPLLPPLSLIFCSALFAMFDRVGALRHAVAVVLSLVIVVAGILTWRHNHIWQSEVKAWQAFFMANPNSLSHQFNLASALAEEGKFEEAKKLYHDILAKWQQPDRGVKVELDAALVGRTWCSLGWILLKQNEPALAVVYFREALIWDPAWSRSWRGLGKALIATGERAHGMQAETMDSFIRMYRKK